MAGEPVTEIFTRWPNRALPTTSHHDHETLSGNHDAPPVALNYRLEVTRLATALEEGSGALGKFAESFILFRAGGVDVSDFGKEDLFEQMQASKGTWRLRHAVADTDKAVDC